MITDIQIQGFKSWKDTGSIKAGPLTGLFGTNSSGKTSIIQMLLLLKQTVESSDRARILHTGDKNTYVDLGTFYDLVHRHTEPGTLSLDLEWTRAKPLKVTDPERKSQTLFTIPRIRYHAEIAGTENSLQVQRFAYEFSDDERGAQRYGMACIDAEKGNFELLADGYELKQTPGRKWPLPPPVKSYGFPDIVNSYYKNAGFLSELVLAYEELFQRVYYLGPLREYPSRYYQWAGERPQDVGQRGEKAVSAMLASRERGIKISRGRGRKRHTVEEHVAMWLQRLGLIESFRLKQIAPNRREYVVRVRRSKGSAEVLITDVGFGVSQVLPVLVLCFYVPEGSTIILEQPEIHLHPSVQAGLADVFINAIKTRDVQIVLESHSEHLLRRLQRRIAEEEIAAEDVKLYFTSVRSGQSHMEPLNVDGYGNILNWPKNFFGDEIGDLAAMTEAAMARMGDGA